MDKPVAKEVRVADLVPYSNNHRIITEKAIQAVVTSIKQYGYNVPILIDEANVIIAGHVRKLALEHLGVETVTCMVIPATDEVSKDKMRLLDNQISAAATWNEVKLGTELRMIQDLGNSSAWDTFSSMFADGSAIDNLLNNSLGAKVQSVTEKKVDKARQKEEDRFSQPRKTNTKDRDVVCPKCKNEFQIRVYET